MRILFVDIGPKRPNEPVQPYGIAVLATVLKQAQPNWEYEIVSIEQKPHQQTLESIDEAKILWSQYDAVCMSVTIWNVRIIHNLGSLIHEQYSIPIILGGPMIVGNSHDLLRVYPYAHALVKGYGETAMSNFDELLRAPRGTVIQSNILKDFISPYLSGVIDLNSSGLKVRMETRRGCPFRCSFCTHRNPETSKTQVIGNSDQWREEFTLFQKKAVKKVNMVNPYFNEGSLGECVLEEAIQAGITAELALQIRPEPLACQYRFLELAQSLNITLEIGVQSLDEDVLKRIHRCSALQSTFDGIRLAVKMGVKLEVTLIYGLPGQTLNSFQSTILQLHDLGVENIVAFPLQILPFTELHRQAKQLGLQTRIDQWGIPMVVQSPWFSADEYAQMESIAIDLLSHGNAGYPEKRFAR